jgi:hypothetical protein
MSTTLVFVGYLGDGQIYVNTPWVDALEDYLAQGEDPAGVWIARVEDGESVGSYMMYGTQVWDDIIGRIDTEDDV